MTIASCRSFATACRAASCRPAETPTTRSAPSSATSKCSRLPPPSSAAYLRANPNADLVTLTTTDGRVIHGERKNEDAFSIQIVEGGGRLQGYFKSSLKNIVRGERAPAAKADPAPGVTYRDILGGLKDPSRWITFSGDYSGQRHSPLTADQSGKRRGPQARMDVPDRHDDARPRVRGDAVALGQRALRHRIEQLRVGARCAHRPAVLDLSPRSSRRSHLRRAGAGESRLRHARPSAVHGHARRALAGVRSRDRPHPVGHRARRLQDRLRRDARAARHRRQGDRRHFRRRVSDARVPRRVRSGDGQAHLAFLDDPQSRRAWQRDLARISRRARARRRRDVDDRHLRSRAQHALLGHRQSKSRLLRRRSQGRQPLHEFAGRHRRRERDVEVALPVHAARHARLGRESRAGAGGLARVARS